MHLAIRSDCSEGWGRRDVEEEQDAQDSLSSVRTSSETPLHTYIPTLFPLGHGMGWDVVANELDSDDRLRDRRREYM